MSSLVLVFFALMTSGRTQDFVFPTDAPTTDSPLFNSALDYEELRYLNASCHPKDTCVTRGRKIDDIKEQTCGCDNTCAIYDNCCIDAHVRKSPFFALRGKHKFSCTSYVNVGYIYVKDTCPPYWTGPTSTVDKCQLNVEDHSDPLSFMPTTNRVAGTTYKNYYCAECNSENATSVVVWQPLVEFTNLKAYNSSYANLTSDYIKNNLAYNHNFSKWGLWLNGDDSLPYFYDATIYPTLPKGLEERVHSCRPRLVSDCPSNWSEVTVATKCAAYQGAIYVRGKTKGYRNVHCAICNGEDTTRLTCTPPKGKAGIEARTFNNEAFSVLLDFHDPKGGSVGNNKACASGEIYDPFHKQCKKLLCGFPWLVVRNNKCVPISSSPVASRGSVRYPVNDQATTDNSELDPKFTNLSFYSTEELNGSDTSTTPQPTDTTTTVKTSFEDTKPVNQSQAVIDMDSPLLGNDSVVTNSNDTEITTEFSQPPSTYKTTVVTYPQDNETTYSVVVEASTMSSTELAETLGYSEDFTLIPELKISTSDPFVEKVTIVYDETHGTNHIELLQLSRYNSPVDKNGLDSNATLVDLGEPPQSLDYEDSRQYAAYNSTQYDYSQEFIDCTKVGLDPSQYVLYDNKTLFVSSFKKSYDARNYLLLENQALVCAFFENATAEAEQSKFSPAMGYITFVGLGVSMVCLVLHLIVYLIVGEMRNLSTNNLAALSTALLLAYLSFIVGQFSTISNGTCVAMAGGTYFFFLASFFWMSAMSFDVWRTLRLATQELRVSNGKQWKRFLGYSIYSWGLSAVALITVMVIDNVEGIPQDYQPRFGLKNCWFAHRMALLVFFAAPLILVMVLNIVLFISSAKMVLTTTRSTAKNYSCTTSSRRNFKLYLRLAVMMGLTWAVGLVAGYLNMEPIWYAFVFLNTLQGLFIFVAFTCNRKVKKYLGERVQILTKRHAYRTQSVGSNSTFPSSSVIGRTNTVTSTSSLNGDVKTPPVLPSNQRPVFMNPAVTSFQQLQDGMETLY